MKFDPETVNQKLLNEIHHHFEILSGPLWNVAPHLKYADRVGAKAICELNELCHETESFIRYEEHWKKQLCRGFFRARFYPHASVPLTLEDYQRFSLKMRFGEVRLHYAQRGKTHLDAYHDNDKDIGDQNITGLRFLTGLFDISFGSEPADHEFDAMAHRFRSWLIEKEVDPDQPELGLGFARVAVLNREDFADQTNYGILQELSAYDDISEVKLHTTRSIFFCKYSYTAEEQADESVRESVRSRIIEKILQATSRKLGIRRLAARQEAIELK